MKLKLTRAQRAAFFASEWPRLEGEGDCPVEPGYVHRLSSRLSFEVLRVHGRKRKRGWRLEYRVIDDREQRFRLMPGTVSFKTDEKGKLLPLPVGEERGMTANPKRRALNAGDVPLSYQEVLTMKARHRKATRDAEAGRSEQQAVEDAARIHAAVKTMMVDMARCGADPTPLAAALYRAIKEHEELDEAA